MAKPKTTKRTRTRSKPATQAPQKAPTPEATGEGSAPSAGDEPVPPVADTQQPQPETTPPAEPAKEEPEVESTAPTGDAGEGAPPEQASQPGEGDEQDSQEPEAPDQPEAPEGAKGPEVPEVPQADVTERVDIGGARGLLRRIPIDVVQQLLGAQMAERVEAERSTPATAALEKRARLTDGRGTPLIFTAAESENTVPALVHGYSELAAAINLGREDVFVILVPAGAVGAVSTHLHLQAQKDQPGDPEEEELLYRVIDLHEEG